LGNWEGEGKNQKRGPKIKRAKIKVMDKLNNFITSFLLERSLPSKDMKIKH